MNLNQIIEAARRGDSRAEKALFMQFAPKVFLLCRRYAGNEEDARDFMQECFLTVFGKLDRFQPEKGVFEGWLHTVCTNVVLQLLRKRKRKVSLQFFEELPEPDPEPEDIQFISDEELLRAIDCLPDGYREVLNLIVFEKWPHARVARKLGITESTSRSQYVRARQFLKKELQKKIPSRHERRLA